MTHLEYLCLISLIAETATSVIYERVRDYIAHLECLCLISLIAETAV